MREEGAGEKDPRADEAPPPAHVEDEDARGAGFRQLESDPRDRAERVGPVRVEWGAAQPVLLG